MNYKIQTGTIDKKFFVTVVFDDEDYTAPLKQGLESFFEKCLLKEKMKKETDHGYFSMSSNSSGCRR